MPLHVCVDSESYDGTVTRLSHFYISRQENLKDKAAGVHRYAISHVLWPWRTVGEFTHEYSDGAGICTQKALEVLPDYLIDSQIPDEPIKLKVSLAGYYHDEKTLIECYINGDIATEVDNVAGKMYGIYKDVWPFDPVASFEASGDDLTSILQETLLSMKDTKTHAQAS